MSLRDTALRYGEFLLHRIGLAAAYRRWDEVESLCERFERLHHNLPPVPSPLVWHGDYA